MICDPQKDRLPSPLGFSEAAISEHWRERGGAVRLRIRGHNLPQLEGEPTELSLNLRIFCAPTRGEQPTSARGVGALQFHVSMTSAN